MLVATGEGHRVETGEGEPCHVDVGGSLFVLAGPEV